VSWSDSHSGYGKQYFEYNHVDKKHKHSHGHDHFSDKKDGDVKK
jgi:hypothetical protein